MGHPRAACGLPEGHLCAIRARGVRSVIVYLKIPVDSIPEQVKIIVIGETSTWQYAG